MDMSGKPIIKYFRIIGLHGYKDVVIDFDSPVRIVIAENGAGKTTILSALHSFLTCKFHNLRVIDFEEIRCVFSTSDEEIILKKKSLLDISSSNIEALGNIVQFSALDEAGCIAYITTEFDPEDWDGMRSSPVGQALYDSSPWDWETIHELLSDALENLESSIDDDIRSITKKIKAAIGNTEILYLPTYRRIEKLFERQRSRFSKRQALANSRRQSEQSPVIRSQMNYGLADVEDRLTALTETVQRRTNFGYREISANIIDDLLAGKAKRSKTDVSDLPDLETLRLFFSRIGGAKKLEENYLDRIQQIYDDEDYEDDSDRDTLIYFLSKLSQVVNQTKQLESTIENFVKKANTYLGETSDVKSFNYDPERMRVSVINKWTSEEVKLNDLSSGEKQVVSLLSYLFLYTSDKIILVDEPELSLSIDWQQKILVDMAAAPTCKQLLAITHSPFIFDNELDPCSSPLKIKREEKNRD
ncbi:AAA family ATPase [Porticoccus litoralis]|uniref:AAA family ATPase n=1 Tax=Porticoccus litoralis TaxID=434086 RepID=A0AAW8B4I8_9GAMM|nr:AAA family ATPase [Porticoccus litoralis]MDP1520631.1 AAA family ATPase [Porticoccus litoralis]